MDRVQTRTLAHTLPIRLMVGLWFLVPAIGVRVPDRQLNCYGTLECVINIM